MIHPPPFFCGPFFLDGAQNIRAILLLSERTVVPWENAERKIMGSNMRNFPFPEFEMLVPMTNLRISSLSSPIVDILVCMRMAMVLKERRNAPLNGTEHG